MNIFARLIRPSDMSMSEIKPGSQKPSEVFTYRIVHLAQEKPLGIHLILINLSHPVKDSLVWAATDSRVSTFNMKIALEQRGEALGF